MGRGKKVRTSAKAYSAPHNSAKLSVGFPPIVEGSSAFLDFGRVWLFATVAEYII